MRAGSLNKRATFQQFTSTPDRAGGSTKAWADFTTVWVQFSPERAREKIQQGRIAENQAGALRLRSSTKSRQIDATFRVIVDDVTYNVRSITNPDQRNDMIEMAIETDGVSGQG